MVSKDEKAVAYSSVLSVAVHVREMECCRPHSHFCNRITTRRNTMDNIKRPGNSSKVVHAQAPEEAAPIQNDPISKSAGGIPAIISTIKSTYEFGLIRGARTLLKLNQVRGVDCPGCAWPEPDQQRSHFEFCENGAKHIADEATTKRLTPEFFKQWSVADLSSQSDHWLGAQGRITHPMFLSRGASHYEAISWDDAFEL